MIFHFCIVSECGAEYLFSQWPKPESVNAAGTAADAKMFSGLSFLFLSLEALEQKDYDKLIANWGEMLRRFSEAEEKYWQISGMIPETPILFDGLTFRQLANISAEFAKFDLQLPDRQKELSLLAAREVSNFKIFLMEINFFRDPVRNRVIVKQIFNSVDRITCLGTAVSEIASVQK